MDDLIFIVKSGLTETQLVHSPDGWDDALLEVERSTKFLGIVRSYSVQLKFVLDGATLLRDIFYNRIDNETTITIKKLNPITLVYESIYTGQFDFQTFTDSEYFVNITVLDNGLSNLIKKNMDKEYQVFLFADDYFWHWENLTAIHDTDYINFSSLLYKLLDKVVDGKLTTGEFALDSTALTYIEALDEHAVLTNSVALAGGRFDRVSMTFSDLLQTIFVLFDLVASVEVISNIHTLVLKSTSETFPEIPSFELTHLSNFKVSVAKDFIYDSLTVGYPTQDDGEATGLDDGVAAFYEFCAEVKFGNDSSFIVNQDLDLTSKIRADIRGINQYYSAWGNADLNNYITFAISIHYSSSISKYLVDFGSVRFESQTAQNIPNTRISPKRLLLKHQKFIDSCFYGNSSLVDFVSAPFNIVNLSTLTFYTDADTQLEGSGYTHSDTPYFIPLYIELEGMMPADFDYNTISVPDQSRLKFNYKGHDYEGFVIAMKLKLVGKVKAQVKLLCAPSNDLTKLIR